MKVNKWTLALAGSGVISLGSVALAEEAPMSEVLTSVASTTLSGYVDTSAIWKFGTGNDRLPGRAFDGVGKLDGFNLNVVGLTLEKPLSEDQWAAGYRVDLLFGPDAVGYNLAVGNNGITSNNSDFGIKQAYVALRTPIGTGLDWKIGTFNTIVGYESFESYLNPNYSRSYGWQLEPTQHTGILASYRITDAVSVAAGVANTYIPGVNLRSDRGESQKTYMASITFTAPESMGFLKGSAFYAGVVDGFSNNNDEAAGTGLDNERDTTLVYVGGSLATPVEGLSVGAAFDYRFNGPISTDIVVGAQPDTSWAWSGALYVSYQLSEKWKTALRADYSRGSDGTWFDGGEDGVSNEQNEIGSLTATIDYALWANVITRAELRWDHAFSDSKPYGGNDNADPDEDAATLALNVIYKF